VIKLKHLASGFRLHSHDIKYGSGSGQQSVTGFPNIDDANSLWVIRGPNEKRYLFYFIV
jgi:dolichyl-phosphate-mannose--protein O-mannosyl transferase